MSNNPGILLAALRDPHRLVSMTCDEAGTLLRLAHQTRVMAKLAQRAQDAGIDDQLNAQVRDHLIAARVVAAQHRRIVRWEADRILHAMQGCDFPIVFLKGAAYVLADLPAGRGRLISDVDIMVPKVHLETAEQRLKDAGWEAFKLDEYDQRYYRQWMHELPPMAHRIRRNVLDLHHTILPETGRLHPDAAKLLAASRLIPSLSHPSAKLLAPADMILHSAAHLFQDGELAGGLRDLLDLDDLLRHFGAHEPDFWNTLVSRGIEMDLRRPLFYALRFSHHMLETPVPQDVLNDAGKAGKPLWPTTPMMDFFVSRAFMPHSAEGNGGRRFGAGLSRWMLYVRSHWLRMPPLMLLQHLTRKAFRRIKKEEEPRTTAQKNIEAKRVG
ncbi:MAG: nucleotidyltransferase family protein [Phycisphaeraceae bacterium]